MAILPNNLNLSMHMALEIEQVRVANADFTGKVSTLSVAEGPFTEGAVFNLNGYDFVQTKINGTVAENAKTKLAFFATELGEGCLQLSTLLKETYDADGKPVKADGTFNRKVRDLIKTMSDNTIEDFCKAVITAQPRGIRAKRKPYERNGQYGRYWSTLVEFDIVD